MQIFVPYKDPYNVASSLDKKRLNRQIQEAKVIINAIHGTGKGWFNHPVVKMYKEYDEWLKRYLFSLFFFREDELNLSLAVSLQASLITPPFLTEEFCNQHKRRLYTKNPEYYEEFADYGTSEENWYVIDNKIVKYINGKRIE